MNINCFEQISQDLAEQCWYEIDKAIDIIQENQIYKLSYLELYNLVYKLIINRYGQMVYKNIKQSFQRVCQRMFDILSVHKEDFLEKMIERWNQAKFIVDVLRHIFLYMDKNFIMPNFHNNIKPVKVVCYEIFIETLLHQNPQIYEQLIQNIIINIRKDRKGEQINKPLMKQIFNMTIDLGIQATISTSNNNQTSQQFQYDSCKEIYKKNIEIKILEETRQFYQAFSTKLIKTIDVVEYVQIVYQEYILEKERIDSYFELSSKEQIINIIMKELIVAHSEYILENKLNFLLKECQIEDLKKLYTLFAKHSQSFEHLRQKFAQFILEEGTEIIKQIRDKHQSVQAMAHQKESQQNQEQINHELVKNLIKFKEDIEKVVNLAFHDCLKENQFYFQRIVKEKFEQFINVDNFVMGILINYFDDCYRQHFKFMQDSQIEEAIQNTFLIFKYIHDKDLFKHYYTKQLANRLVQNKSVNEKMEEFMISKLKIECGPSYTNKLETMIKDVNNSRLINQEYKSTLVSFHQKKSLNSIIDFEISVYTTGHWPYQDEPSIKNIVYPEILKAYIENFESFYYLKRPQTKLVFHPDLGKVQLKANYNGHKKELEVSTFQMLILLIFNDVDSITFKNLCLQINVDQNQMHVILQTLVKKQILICQKSVESISSSNNIFNADDIIIYNSNFQDKQNRITFSQKSISLDKSLIITPDSNQNEFMLERKYLLDSQIVKIMKQRKFITHQELVNEVKQISINFNYFTPDNKLIKQQIETLISREYLKREGEKGDAYSYIA